MSNPYAAIDREPIWLALFAKLKAALGSNFVTYGRRHIPPPDLTPEQQPALFVIQVRESKIGKPRGTTGQLVLHALLILYCYQSGANEQAGQETAIAATQLNSLKKAIDDAIAPAEYNGVQTLGGLVSHCWVEGDTEEDPGVFGQQAVAVIPIHILVP